MAASGKPTPPSPEREEAGLGLKAAWLGAEQLGNLRAAFGQQQQPAAAAASVPQRERLSREEAVASIREDYDRDYFISGRGEMAAYADNCQFADEFASFSGTPRFKRNVANLGGMLKDVQLDVTGWEEGPDSLQTRWRFNAILDLPWRPRLAAAGGTKHVFSPETGRVVQHIETWDVEPWAVLRSLLKPSSKVANSQWEVLMASLYSGDPAGIWLGLSPAVALLTAVALPLGEVAHLARGEGLVFGPGEGAALAGLVAALASQLYELVRTFAGGRGV